MVCPTPLLITLEYPPQVGGVANYYASLVKALSLPCIVADATVLPQSWLKMIPWLYRQIKQQHYSHILVGQVLPLGTATLVVHWLTGTPYIIFTHGMDVLIPQRYLRKRWLLQRVLRSAQHIVAVSQFTANQIYQFDASLTVTVIHPAAHITPELPIKPVSNLPQQFILSVGRLVERKGFDMIIRSIVHFPDVHYVIAGQGADEFRLIELAKQYAVQNRVHFFHDLTNAQIAYLYQHCLFLVMPSRQLADGDVEGFGIVVLEANSFGKTALGGTDGGMADAIQNGITGLLVDGTDHIAVTEAIRGLLDLDYRHTLEVQTKQFSESHSWEYAAKQLYAIVNDND